MPATGRRPDPAVDRDRLVRSQEQELKRARGAISCAECRRLKLKCDKTVPCSSCKRRGCETICPNGSLTTGQGTRFILADTDRLHRKIAEMSDRIRQLEDGLAILQSSVTREPHPLLAPDLLPIKSGLELHSARNRAGLEGDGEAAAEDEEEAQVVDTFGTLAVRDDGAATFYGRSAGSESLLLDEKSHHSPSTSHLPSEYDLPPDINRLAATFPHGRSDINIQDLQDLIEQYLPPWPRAAQLCDLYLEQAPWFFGALKRAQLVDEVLPHFYQEAADSLEARQRSGHSPPSLGSTADAFNLPEKKQTASSHDLALLFVVFCFGALTDSTLPPAPHNEEASRYYQLTRAALSLEPVLDRPPSVTTVQTLSLMGIYQGMVSNEHSIEITWSLMGLASKLAQSVGLHRDPGRFKLSTAEVQKRRALFWELFITDCWQALATGRLPTFSLPYVDTELAADPDQTIADDGTPQPSFPAWKARWGKECVSGVMGVLLSSAPKYSVILDLDRRIRDVAMPKHAKGGPPEGAGLAETMSHYMSINYLHLTLLYVHRTFFAQAIMNHPTDPMRSPYSPSFLAGYRSACALLGTVREQFARFPVQIARFWVLWTHAFSSTVMLQSVVTHCGTSKTAQAAFGEVRMAHDLFERAAKHGGRAVKFLPAVRKLLDKAQKAYYQGMQPRRDIFTPRTAESEEQDELSIFSGHRARTVATKVNKPPPRSGRVTSSTSNPSSSAPTPPESADARNSASPASDLFPSLDSSYRSAIHPVLIDEMRTFDGELDAQIDQASAYYANAQQDQHMFAYEQSTHVAAVQPQYEQQQWYDQQSQSVSPPSSTQGQYSAVHSQHPSPPSQYYTPSPQDMYQHAPHMQAPVEPPPAHHVSSVASNPPLRLSPYSSLDPAQYKQHQYAAPAHPPPEHTAYVPPSHPPPDTQHRQPRPELWNVHTGAPQAVSANEELMYPTSPEYEHPTGAYAYQHPNQSASHIPAAAPAPAQSYGYGYGTAPQPQQYVQQAHPHQHSQHAQQHAQYQSQQVAPAPPPMQLMTSGYSLQETWTSFFQHELPGAPVPQQTIPSQMQR